LIDEIEEYTVAAQYIDEQKRVCWMTFTTLSKIIPETEESLEN